ncbi:unnamed protein product [Dicrocoelium dendriticum]|nr:unnamed protein product [Dicrocoelium dendriticum]
MSSLPKRRYQMLSTAVDSSPEVTPSGHPIEWGTSTTHACTLNGEGYPHNGKEALPILSGKQVFSYLSTESPQNMSPLPQIYDAYQRQGSSQSESWFTASSLMDSSLDSSLEMQIPSDKAPIIYGDKLGEETLVKQVTNPFCLASSHHKTAECREDYKHWPADQLGLGMANEPLTLTSVQSASLNTTVNPPLYTLRHGFSSSIKSTQGEVSKNSSVDKEMLANTAPSAILRIKWKRFFASRRGDTQSQGAKDARHKLNTLHIQNPSINSVPISPINGLQKTEERASGVAKLSTSVGLRESSLMPELLGSKDGLLNEEDEPSVKHASQSSDYMRPAADVRVESRERKGDNYGRQMSSPAVCMRKPAHQLSKDRIRKKTRVSLASPSNLDELFKLTDSGIQLEAEHFCTDHAQVQEIKYGESRRNADEKNVDLESHPVTAYRSSFEFKEPVQSGLVERKVHVGALALAWATGERKTKKEFTATEPTRESQITNRRTGLLPSAVQAAVDSVRASPISTGTISRQILGKFQAQKPSGHLQLPREDSVESKDEGSERKIGQSRLTGDSPFSLKFLPFKRKLFHKYRPSHYSEYKLQRSEEERTEDEDLGKWMTEVDEKPTGPRAQMRRGGMDIAPMCPAGGPFNAKQAPSLQKPQAHNISWRLSRRKMLNERRRKVADYSLGFAILGILLMVFELEFLMAKVYVRESFYSLLMKSLISASTFILTTLILLYHVIDTQLFSVNNCIEDWRIATSWKRISLVALEVILCLIHPPPFISNYDWSTGSMVKYKPYSIQRTNQVLKSMNSSDIPLMYLKTGNQTNWLNSKRTHFDASNNSNTGITHMHSVEPTPLPIRTAGIDLTGPRSENISLELNLCIPMFFRLFLIFRVLLLHSSFFTDAGSQSIGALNRVKINVRFVLKTLATAQPGTMLLIFILSMWVVTSWIMRVCERDQNPEYEKMFNTMWLIAVTFLSIGYGDMVPSTHCGRSTSVIAGVMGSACTALVVAVVARKLELSRAEKHVHNFMQDNKVYKQIAPPICEVANQPSLRNQVGFMVGVP